MIRRFGGGSGDAEIMQRSASLRIQLYRGDEGEISGEFEIRGYFGRGGAVELCGLPVDDNAAEFAKRLMDDFKRARPQEPLL